MKNVQKSVLVGVILLLLAGCGGKKVVRHYPRPIASAPPALQVMYIAPDPLAEDPLVIKARAVGQQRAINRARWDRACLEMRRADPVYTTYTDCRRLLGDRESFSPIGYMGGSIFSNSPGIVWKE